MTYVARWRWLLLRGVVADRKALSEVGGIVAPRLTRPSPHVRWLRGGRAFTRLPGEFYCRQETSSAAAAAVESVGDWTGRTGRASDRPADTARLSWSCHSLLTITIKNCDWPRRARALVHRPGSGADLIIHRQAEQAECTPSRGLRMLLLASMQTLQPRST